MKGTFLRYHRPDVLKVLVGHLPSHCKTHFSRRLQSYSQRKGAKIDLFFSDNSRETCDVLIGADGIKSAVRRSLLMEQADIAARSGRVDEADGILRCINPKWSGIVAYRALIPTERLQAFRDAHPEANIRVPEANSIPIMVRHPTSHAELLNFLMLPQYMGQNVVSFDRYLFLFVVKN
jgi:salicylate hydroxylase